MFKSVFVFSKYEKRLWWPCYWSVFFRYQGDTNASLVHDQESFWRVAMRRWTLTPSAVNKNSNVHHRCRSSSPRVTIVHLTRLRPSVTQLRVAEMNSACVAFRMRWTAVSRYFTTRTVMAWSRTTHKLSSPVSERATIPFMKYFSVRILQHQLKVNAMRTANF